jgi:Zn-dependent peptidase ImmA (M78 family)
MTRQFRKILGIREHTPIDILAVLEIAMPLLDTDFNYSVRENADMEVDAHAYTDHDNSEIVILDEIYERAVEGRGRDRLTIAHEIGHYLLHNKQMCVLTRVYDGEKVLTYEDPEWQANAFAGELLCPALATRNYTVEELVIKFGVSADAAKTQKKKGGQQ